jgi:hypothetical protein
MLRWLSQAVIAMHGGNRLTFQVIGPIIDRIRGIKQRFARLAARLAAGTYKPRRCTARGPRAAPNPRRKNPLPQKFGWLIPLVPEAVVFRAQLENLLRDPAMAALMAAAPDAMARPLRSLCWMLRVDPPAILPRPRPRKRAAPPPKTPPPARAAPPAPPPPQPAWMPRRTRWTMTRIRGSPRPA